MSAAPWLAASGHVPKIPADWPGWLVLILIGLGVLYWLAGVLGLRKD